MTYSTFSLRRLSALFIAMLMLLCHVPFSALAEDALPPFYFALTWMEGETPMEAVSVEVTEPGYEGSHWLYVPGNALASDATLEIRDTQMQYASFSLASGTPLTQLQYTDAADLGGAYLDVFAYDANGQIANQFRLYISTLADAPATPAPVPVTVSVPVYYVDQNGNIIQSSSATVSTGDNPVYADDSLMPDYDRTSEGTAWVSVDYNGNCNPASVTFTYAPKSVTTNIDVIYYDESNNEIARDSAQVSTGDNYVAPKAELLPAGYELTSADSVYVSVDSLGNCNPGSVAFYCKAASVTVNVDVIYYDENNNEIARDSAQVSTGDNYVAPKAELVPAGYELTSADSVYVSVDSLGNCNPGSVAFYCKAASVTVNVDVIYYDENNNEIARDSAQVSTGDNYVAPKAELLPAGYELTSADSVYVAVDSLGNCNPGSVAFYCKAASVTVNVDVIYYDENNNEIARDSAQVSTGDNYVAPKAELLPAGYELTSADSVYVSVDSLGNCNPGNVAFYCKAASVTVNIDVIYYDESNNEIARDSAQVSTGDNYVAPKAELVPAGYELTSTDSVYVSVDSLGNCNPGSVAFYCKAASVTVNVDVIYYDENNNEIARDSAQVSTGDNYVAPKAELVPTGYELTSADSVYVSVDSLGNCNPGSVTFSCKAITATVNIDVVYIDQTTNVEIARTTTQVSTGTPAVEPGAAPAGYALADATPVTVIVDAYGNCDPAVVTFYCVPAVVTVDIPVYYYDAQGALIAETTFPVTTGENLVQADLTLIPNHVLDGDASATVLVDNFGVCTPESVTFFCKLPEVPTDTPAPTDVPTDTPEPTDAPTEVPTDTPEPTDVPTEVPTDTPEPTDVPTEVPTDTPEPTDVPTEVPTDTPEPTDVPTDTPEPVVVTVIVRYVNAKEETIYSESVTLTEGANAVAPQSSMLPAGYTLENDVPVVVTVDAAGTATPFEVVFRCLSNEPEATPAPVDVTVLYLDENDNPVASATYTTCYVGVNHISPNPTDLRENYTLIGEDKQYVVVDENGATPATVTFRYSYQPPVTPTPTVAPAPKVALVPVRYTLQNGQTFYTDNTLTCTEGENIVTPNVQYVPADYELKSASSVTVTVDANGIASPSVVEFIYSAGEVTRDITIYYRTADGHNVASPQVKTCYVGMNVLACEPLDLVAGYTLISLDTVTVVLDELGNLTLDGQPITDGVTFLFEAPPTPTPPPTQMPYQLHEMSGYCYPKSDTINFRSEPSTASDSTVLRVVTQQELGRIEGYVINDRNEKWYVVTIGEQTGFLRENVVRLLSQDEINQLFGYTPTPAPTQIPDGAIIDRWGIVNTASVNFRNGIGGERLYLMSKGAYIFVYESETVNGETWYHGRYNDGKGFEDGSVMAKYIDLLSEEDSLAYQQSLPTPMPVRTAEPTATPVPTDTPVPVTPTPTVSPTPTVVITATPAPYTGYALTTRAVDLRTGVTVGDTTLTTLPAHSLVYLWGQAYIDGVCWHSAEALQANLSGYLPDDVLQRITPEEAAPYLAALLPQSSPTIAPTDTPAPYTGYAVTNGNNVLLRAYANTNAEIIEVLSAGEVVWVLTQEYVEGESWQIVRFGNIYGYIRGDQLRMMSYDESIMYEESLRTATPAPAATPTIAPITQESLSSYGYVTTNNVRLRSGAGTSSDYIRMMNQYAFALVLGTEEVDGQTWYHINQAGTEGYVMGDYFKVLSMGELTEFLTSDEYLQSQENTAGNGGGANVNTGSGLTSYEDFNNAIWQNPAMATASYEPFSNLIATPTPNVESVATPTPSPTVSVLPTTNFEPYVTPSPNSDGGSGSGLIWLALAGIGIIAGGGVYAYSIHRQNQRRAAQRAAQRKAAQQQAARNAAYQRPQTQYPQQNMQQTQKYQSAFTPPTPRTTQTPDVNASAETPAQSADAANTTVRRRRSDRHQG